MLKFSGCQRDIVSIVQVVTGFGFLFLIIWLKHIVLLNQIKTWKQRYGKTDEKPLSDFLVFNAEENGDVFS